MVHAAKIRPSLLQRSGSAFNRWRSLARAVLQKYYADELSVRAASLSYWSLLSLVPFLAVTFSVLKAFGGHDLIAPLLIALLEPLGHDRHEIVKRIVGFVDNTNVGVLGAVGVAGLFYTVIALIGNVEEAVNQIWRAHPVRNWTRRYGEFLGLLLIVPVLLFATFAMIAAAQSTISGAERRPAAVRASSRRFIRPASSPPALECSRRAFPARLQPKAWRASVRAPRGPPHVPDRNRARADRPAGLRPDPRAAL